MEERLTINEEIERNDIQVDPSKRSGKTKELKSDEIDTNLYATKAYGLVSLKPMTGLQKFDSVYGESSDFLCDWRTEINTDWKYIENQLHLYSTQNNSKIVTFHIYLTT